MRVLHVGIFEDHFLGGDVLFRKGLLQNDCEVVAFDHRRRADLVGFERMNEELVELAAAADLVFIGKGDRIAPQALRRVRRRGAAVALWYGDLRPEPEPWLLELLPQVDCYFMSSAGPVLRHYYERGRPGRAAYYFNPSDPDVATRFDHLPRGIHPVTFIGTPHALAGSERRAVIAHLKARGDVAFFGGADRTGWLARGTDRVARRLTGVRPGWVRGERYVAALRSGCISVSVSAFQDAPGYTSDRLTHLLSCGTFVAAWHFPGVERLFEPGAELATFRGVQELDITLERWLADEARREAVARAGRERVFRYDTRAVVAMMLDVAQHGRSDRFEWVEVLG